MIREPVGEQLELSLDDVRLKRIVVPWGGASPRVLTRGHAVSILKAQAAKNMSDGGAFVQGDLFVVGTMVRPTRGRKFLL